MRALVPARDELGRLLPGHTANPGGRPHAERDVVALAREGSPAAIRRLMTIVDDPEAPYAAQIAAATHVLDRAFGRPRQTVDVEQQGRTLEEILLAIAAAREAEQAQERAGGERPATKSE